MKRGFKNIAFSLVAASCLVCGLTETSVAQNDSSRRQEMFDSLLKSLIESQLNRPQEAPQVERVNPNVAQPQATTNQLREVRELSRSFSQELSRLFDILNQDIRHDPYLAVHFNSTLKVSANAAVLARRSEQARDLATLRPDFTELDREWRALSYQLESSNISQACKSSVRTVNSYHQRLAKLFEMNPQIDSQKFMRLTDSLEVSVDNLMDEISTELGWTNETRQLLLMGRICQQQVRYMTLNTEVSRNRERAVAEYNKFQQLWAPFASQLWPLKNRYIERDLQRIEQIDRDLQEVLLLPIATDHRQLVRLSEVLQTELTGIMEATTLNDLVTLKHADNVEKTARDFQGSVKRLITSAQQNRDLNQLQNDFRMVDTQWTKFEDAYKGCEKSEILRLLKSTEKTMASLREGVKIQSTFNRSEALQVIASLENYGKHLQDDFSTYVVQGGRYDRGFAYQGLHTCHQFTAFANNIHQSLADGADPEDLRDRCEVLARGWNYLNNEYLLKLQGAERIQLSELSAEITPQIVRLQTMFGF